MLTKITSWIVAISLLVAGCALADTLNRADAGLDADALARYWSWTLSDDGEFSVVTNAAAKQSALFEDQSRNLSGALCFYVELRGNVKTGICYPVLKIMYIGSSPIGCNAVSIALDGVRYDFVARTEGEKSMRGQVENINVYLDAQGLELINAIGQANSVSVCLHGDTQYITKLERKDSYSTTRARVENASLNLLELPEGAPDFDVYGLSDLALELYKSKNGVVPRMETYEIAAESPIPTDSAFGYVSTGSSSARIRQVQTLLADCGFLLDSPSSSVSYDMRLAIRRAQQYYGLIVTGAADARLINLLSGAKPSAAEANALPEDKWSAESDSIAFTINRWWHANSADTSVPGTLAKVPADTDNTLIIADGWVISRSASAISLSFEASAVFTYNGKYDFNAQLFCENNSGTGFTSTLGALSSSRILAYAEIPAYLLKQQGEWTLTVAVDDATCEYALK